MKFSLGMLCVALALGGTATKAVGATFTRMGDLPGVWGGSEGHGVSADGNTVVGDSLSVSGFVATRWTMGTGLVPLKDPQGLPILGIARAASTDGSIIAGSFGGQAFRWTASSGAVGLGDLPGGPLSSGTYAMSADGSVIVGYGRTATRNEAFRWTATTGMTSLGVLPGAGESVAKAVSADGSIIAGDSAGAFLWTASGGMVSIPALAGSKGVAAMSADGSIIAGHIWVDTHDEAYLWSASGGMTTLGVFGPMPPGGLFGSYPNAVSADASVVVGTMVNRAGNSAFLWTAAGGIRSLRDVLISDYGLGAEMSDWHLSQAFAVSADGLVIAGYGEKLGKGFDGWVVDLRPAAPVPEPETYALMLAGVALVAWAARRRPSR